MFTGSTYVSTDVNMRSDQNHNTVLLQGINTVTLNIQKKTHYINVFLSL